MTTPYLLQFSPTAVRQIKDLAPKYRKIIIKLAEALSINPRPPGAHKIEGMTGLYSEAVEHLRIIYKIEDQEILILVVK